MQSAAHSPAASPVETCPPSPGAFAPSTADRGAAVDPFQTDTLPLWVINRDALALLRRAVAEKPERTVPLSEWACGTVARHGYRGKAAAALRVLWEDWFWERAAWCDAARPDLVLYTKRRNALLAIAETDSSDALIARLIGGDA